ncbi:MAG: response regulator [Acidovorax sp.]|uniref:response regulator n=1 Tax=Acidovorax sp. TaxID=1872122 RepID=UPI002609AF1B|nr:response regulator [Acidovorax sp.]MDH4462505.1 response regulator [Acidovorax sp.]
MQTETSSPIPQVPDHYTTLEVAKLLGMAVRSVQLMVDRHELDAWKTPGGHRRISRASVERWINARGPAAIPGGSNGAPASPQGAVRRPGGSAPAQVLLIEDSIHFQNLVSLIVQQHFPGVALHVANDGIAGLALYGQTQPDVLIVDILLPGIDGATLITTLRSHPQFTRSQLIVVTSLDEQQREPYAFALQGVRVIHKPSLVAELPAALAACLPAQRGLQ